MKAERPRCNAVLVCNQAGKPIRPSGAMRCNSFLSYMLRGAMPVLGWAAGKRKGYGRGCVGWGVHVRLKKRGQDNCNLHPAARRQPLVVAVGNAPVLGGMGEGSACKPLS